MRFAGNTSNVSSWIQAGKAGAKGAADAFKVARASAPDYGGIGEAHQKARSMERQAATAAEAQVAQAGIKALETTRKAEIKTESELKVLDKKLDAKRMAGIVGAVGTIAGGAFMGVENNRAKKRQAERDAKDDARWEERMQIMREGNKTTPKAPEAVAWQADTFEYDGVKPTKETLGDDWLPDHSGGDDDSPGKSDSPVKPVNTGSGGMSPEFAKIYNLAVKDGRTKFPEIVAAQAMHETGHLQNPDSVYFKSGKTNPFGQTGDRGYGTMTRSGDSNGWSKFPDLQTAVSDHITLWHDTANNSGNYNAFSNINEGLASVIPAYSPNSDPANKAGGFTENAYSASVKKILRDNGFDVK